nr:hypothetical protein [Tanacetum cinerariifolium]
VGEDNVVDNLWITWNELDNILRKTGLEQNLVDKSRGINIGGRRLPKDNVAHQGRSSDQVAADGCEVERGNGVDESLNWAVVHAR